MNKPVRVLYEDDCLVAVDKPSGLLVIPSPGNEKNTLVNIINEQYDCLETEGGVSSHRRGRLHPCHRLDRETSGVIIFARGKKNQQLMMREFHRRAVKKKYVAFVRGQMEKRKGEIRGTVCPVGHARGPARGKARGRAKFAVTRYNVRAVKEQFSVVDVFPETGRTNQIRIHFRKIGHPLLGERVYAFGKDFPLKFRRLALHAGELAWCHPVRKKQVRVFSELPKDMKDFLREQEVAIANR